MSRIDVKSRLLFINRISALFLLFVVIVSSLTLIATKAESLQTVYIVPVEQEIERGLEKFLQRSFQEAATQKADRIILEIDTLGGEIAAADRIGKLIREQETPIIAFIKNEAISAGAYIALNADEILMTPGSRIGSAAAVDLGGNMAEQKIFSYWVKSMEEAARLNDRDPMIARGMVDPEIEIPGITPKGELITLGASEAAQVGYAEKIVNNREEVLTYLFGDAADVEIITMELTAGEKIARFVTSPYVMAVLLLIGLVGVATELFIPGFGFPGIIGISAFGLYFFGHYIAGFAEWENIFLFIIGVILLVIEIFIPGFGIFGAVGIISIAAGLVLAAYDLNQGFTSLGIAFVLSFIVMFIILKYFGHRGVWKRFILKDEMTTAGGYVAPKTRSDLVGKSGKAITPLRPAGTAQFGDERIDVVSEGEYIPAGSSIVVISVEGGRTIVRKIE